MECVDTEAMVGALVITVVFITGMVIVSYTTWKVTMSTLERTGALK